MTLIRYPWKVICELIVPRGFSLVDIENQQCKRKFSKRVLTKFILVDASGLFNHFEICIICIWIFFKKKNLYRLDYFNHTCLCVLKKFESIATWRKHRQTNQRPRFTIYTVWKVYIQISLSPSVRHLRGSIYIFSQVSTITFNVRYVEVLERYGRYFLNETSVRLNSQFCG